MTRLLQIRWMRFSLRWLFVAVLLAAIWLGIQANWIHQRREFFDREAAALPHDARIQLRSGAIQVVERQVDTANKPLGLSSRLAVWLWDEPTFPRLMLIRFEDSSEVGVSGASNLALARQLFPEAEIHLCVLIHKPAREPRGFDGFLISAR